MILVAFNYNFVGGKNLTFKSDNIDRINLASSLSFIEVKRSFPFKFSFGELLQPCSRISFGFTVF